MDAFFASVEQRDRPELRGQPVIVGATSPRGVVAAASYEARRFGVRSAMPGFRARELCPHGIYLASDMEKYARVSAQVHAVFAELTPEIEPVALDEAYLDITASARLFGGPLELARTLKRRVRETVDLPISVGIGPTQQVAKIACTLGKPDGLLLVPPEAVRWLLDPLPVRRLHGVGPVLGERLARLGVRSVADLGRFDAPTLEHELGELARELQAAARGEDLRPVVSDREPRSYSEECTFERDVLERDRVSAVLTAHAEAVARRLRRDGYQGRVVTLKMKLGRRREARRPGELTEPVYPLITRRKTLAAPTDDGGVIRGVALALWDQAAVAEPVRLLGVALSGLQRRDRAQLELFAPRRPLERLGPTLDAIEARFGRGAIRRAVDDPGKVTPGVRRKRGE